MKGVHLLIDEHEGCLTGIIDIGYSWKDPAVDFCFFPMYGKAFLTMVLESYASPNDVYFEEKIMTYYRLLPFDGLIYGALRHDEQAINMNLEWLQIILDS
ncbi:hypothetical protein D3C75_771580 [compost metagenome]